MAPNSLLHAFWESGLFPVLWINLVRRNVLPQEQYPRWPRILTRLQRQSHSVTGWLKVLLILFWFSFVTLNYYPVHQGTLFKYHGSYVQMYYFLFQTFLSSVDSKKIIRWQKRFQNTYTNGGILNCLFKKLTSEWTACEGSSPSSLLFITFATKSGKCLFVSEFFCPNVILNSEFFITMSFSRIFYWETDLWKNLSYVIWIYVLRTLRVFELVFRLNFMRLF